MAPPHSPIHWAGATLAWDDAQALGASLLRARTRATVPRNDAVAEAQGRRYYNDSGVPFISRTLALWHCLGGEMAVIADIVMLSNVLRRDEYGVLDGYLEQSGVSADSVTNFDVWAYDAVGDPARLTTIVTKMAETLEGVVTWSERYVKINYETSTAIDPHGIAEIIAFFHDTAELLREGPDETGRYLSDDLVYGALAGPDPRATPTGETDREFPSGSRVTRVTPSAV